MPCREEPYREGQSFRGVPAFFLFLLNLALLGRITLLLKDILEPSMDLPESRGLTDMQ